MSTPERTGWVSTYQLRSDGRNECSDHPFTYVTDEEQRVMDNCTDSYLQGPKSNSYSSFPE